MESNEKHGGQPVDIFEYYLNLDNKTQPCIEGSEEYEAMYFNSAYTRNVLRHFLFKAFWAGKPYKFGVQTINRKSGINILNIVKH